MKFRQHSLRKAAILVASLDSSTADILLDQMGPQQADEVRHAILHWPRSTRSSKMRSSKSFSASAR